jgi:hypothetical protein
MPIAEHHAATRVTLAMKNLMGVVSEAAPQGRAEDILAGFTCDFHPRLASEAGYRLLEGEADSGEVYNFTLVNHAALGLIARL